MIAGAIGTHDKVVIDADRCKGCGLCVSFCPPQILSISTSLNRLGYRPAVIAGQDRCTLCRACALICPDTAIALYGPARKGGDRALA